MTSSPPPLDAVGTVARSPLDRLAFVLATGFGSGYSPLAPGTAGTIAAVPLYLLLCRLHPAAYLGALVALTVLAIAVADRAAKLSGIKDPGFVVIDEWVGFIATMAFVTPSLSSVVAGFFIFRVYDILKPGGARRLESLPGGYGIVMDDFLAGVWGNLTLRVLALWLLKPTLPA